MIGGVSGVAGIDGKRERRHRHRLSISKKKIFSEILHNKRRKRLASLPAVCAVSADFGAIARTE